MNTETSSDTSDQSDTSEPQIILRNAAGQTIAQRKEEMSKEAAEKLQAAIEAADAKLTELALSRSKMPPSNITFELVRLALVVAGPGYLVGKLVGYCEHARNNVQMAPLQRAEYSAFEDLLKAFKPCVPDPVGQTSEILFCFGGFIQGMLDAYGPAQTCMTLCQAASSHYKLIPDYEKLGVQFMALFEDVVEKATFRPANQ